MDESVVGVVVAAELRLEQLPQAGFDRADISTIADSPSGVGNAARIAATACRAAPSIDRAWSPQCEPIFRG